MILRGGITDIRLDEEGLAKAAEKLTAGLAAARDDLGRKAAEHPLNAWGLMETACELAYLDQQMESIESLKRMVADGRDLQEAGRWLRDYLQTLIVSNVGEHGSNEAANIAKTAGLQGTKDLAEALRWATEDQKNC